MNKKKAAPKKTVKEKTKGAKELSQEQFLLAFPTLRFNISKTCEKIGITRRTFYDWMKEDSFVNALNDAKQAKIDLFEEHLFEQSEMSITTATIFALKCQAKDRGYSEDNQNKIDIGEIKITIVPPNQ